MGDELPDGAPLYRHDLAAAVKQVAGFCEPMFPPAGKQGEMRRVAIYGGGDWSDASVEHLEVPQDLDLDQARKARAEWYRGYVPGKTRYLSFSDFLVERCGARPATDIEEYWEYGG